jgi:hypothetical protein
MSKYHKIIDAEQYHIGMESGFSCIPFQSQCLWFDDYIFKNCLNCKIDTKKKPFITDKFCHKHFINEGDYIVWVDNETREVVCKEDFESEYELLSEL